VLLTVDLGTSVTKVSLWDPGLVSCGRAELAVARPAVGWEEQDAEDWWRSVVEAAAAARAAAGLGSVAPAAAVVCCGARQTFVTVEPSGRPTGPGILWSDRRAGGEVDELLERSGGAEAVEAATGAPLAAESVAAKLAWLARHRKEDLDRAGSLLTPRDYVVHRLSGELATDTTMASRCGLYDLEGRPLPELVGPADRLLPPVLPSDAVVGSVQPRPAEELGVPTGTPVVVGAGDRACEVLGTGASASVPMVSWGTTASVVVPVAELPEPRLPGLVVSRSATEGWLLEGGLSAAGALLEWIGRLCGQSIDALVAEAARRPPGARGVVAAPWLGGARAPWWRDGARAGFVGAGADHDAADLTRAAVEAVAADVRRCISLAVPATGRGASADPDALPAGALPVDGVPVDAMALAGRGGASALWPEVVAAVCGVPARSRASGEAASAGAALLGARAVGMPLTVDEVDPPAAELAPDPAAVGLYTGWRRRAEVVARALVELDLGPEALGGG